tara:strand:+ start:855 stop:1097 length:243 start_codon:yes stop_codon:yes gene_type:complete
VDNLSRRLAALQKIMINVTKTGFSLVGLIILVYLLLGEDSGPYVVSVITNISLFVSAVTSQALIAFVIVAGLLYFGKNNK